MNDMKGSDQSRKSSRYLKWTIVSCVLLALLWPLGNFVFWIMLGFISYFAFLSYYYQPKATPVFQRPNSTSGKLGDQEVNPLVFLFRLITKLKPIQWVIGAFVLLVVLTVLMPNLMSNNSENLMPSADQTVNLDSLVDLGNERYNSGQYESALSYYDKVLEVDPTNQFGLYNKALVYYSKKDYRTSISLVNYCIEANPDYGPAYYLLGDDFKFIDKLDSAIIFFERAYELGVRDSGLLQNLGDISYEQKEKERAIKFYKEAIEVDTTLVFVYERLAELEPSNSSLYLRKAAVARK